MEDGAPGEQPARRRPQAVPWVLALAVLAAAGAVIAWLVLRDDDPSAGPLRQLEASSVGIPQRGGVPFGFGLPVAINHGTEPAVLERIELVDSTPGLDVVATHAGGPERRYFWFATSSKWPAPDLFSDLHPVPGTVVEPRDEPAGERGVELVFVLRADKAGRYAFKAVSVDYRVGDTQHRTVIRNGLRACVVPRGQRRPRCPPPPKL